MTKTATGWFQLMNAYNKDTVMITTDLDIMWLIRYSGWQKMHRNVYFYYIVQRFKIPNNTE